MSTGRSFLIVSRNLGVQDACVRLLRSERAPALGVSTQEEAVRLASVAPAAAVLFDVERGEDWMSLARLRHDLPRDVPIVALCGWLAGDRIYRNLARDLGCAGFVANTAPVSLVLRALQRAAGGSPWSEYVDVCV